MYSLVIIGNCCIIPKYLISRHDLSNSGMIYKAYTLIYCNILFKANQRLNHAYI